MRNLLACLEAIHSLPTEAIEDPSGSMFLVADGIDDPAATRVQRAGLAVHIRNEVVRDVPEPLPLAGPTTAGKQDDNLPSLVLKRALPFGLRHAVLRAHVFEQIHVPSSLIQGRRFATTNPTPGATLHPIPPHSHTPTRGGTIVTTITNFQTE